VGRYAIDLPPGAKTELRTQYGIHLVDDPVFIYLDGVRPEDLRKIVTERVKELKGKINEKKNAPLYIATYDLPNDGIAIHQWKSSVSDSLQILECYFITYGDRQYIFKYEYRTLSEYQEKNFKNCVFIGENLYSREPDEAPQKKGFCIDHGFVAINTMNFGNDTTMYENSRLTFSLPEHPRAFFTLYVRPLAGEPVSILSRLDTYFMLMGFRDKKTLRRSGHDVGPIDGEEICVSGVSHHKVTDYNCHWSSPGKKNDLGNQDLSLELMTDALAPAQPSFSGPEEMLGIWDAIVNSIRLNPGAI
jgi:hypothetical protein